MNKNAIPITLSDPSMTNAYEAGIIMSKARISQNNSTNQERLRCDLNKDDGDVACRRVAQDDQQEISIRLIHAVGGKNASLGELFKVLRPNGVGVLDGFATTAEAYRRLLATHDLEPRRRAIFTSFDVENLPQLAERGEAARRAVMETPVPEDVRTAIAGAYDRLCDRAGREPELAVRSSATAEDLPEASFAGAAETFLNVRGREALLRAVHACCASLYTDRAVSYRARLGYDQLTVDTESGFRDVVAIPGAYGLGEFVVKGTVIPDGWTVFKPTLLMRAHATVSATTR